MNSRTIALVLALVLAGTFAFPSAASPFLDGPADRLGSDVSLVPSSDYAYLDDDEELVVDLSPTNPDLDGEGVNADGRTTIGEVFHLRYNGSRFARVWLTHESDAVSFAVDGRTIESANGSVVLGPNESVAVSMTVDTTGEAADGLIDGITVHSRVAEPGTATESDDDGVDGPISQSLSIGENSRELTVLSAEPGEPVRFDTSRLELDRVDGETLTFDELEVTSANRSFRLTAERTGTETARSLVVGAGPDPLGAVNVSVRSGTVTGATLRFSVSQSYFDRRGVDPGNLAVYRYSDGELSRLPVSMTGERDGRLTFETDTPGFSTFVVAVDRPRFALAGTGLDARTVAPGEAVTVDARVTNDGTLAGERTVTVAVDGRVVAERTVTVAAGATETVSVPVVRNTTGEYSVTVDGTDAGTFRVVAANTATPPPQQAGTEARQSTDAATGSPVAEPSGFGLRSLVGLIGLLIIVASTLALARRTPRP